MWLPQRRETQARGADEAVGKIVAGLNATKKRARSAAQHWMHENWRKGRKLEPVVSARWEAREDKSDANHAINFRMSLASEWFAELPQEEQEAWKQSAQEEGKRAKGKAVFEGNDDDLNNPVDIAS